MNRHRHAIEQTSRTRRRILISTQARAIKEDQRSFWGRAEPRAACFGRTGGRQRAVGVLREGPSASSHRSLPTQVLVLDEPTNDLDVGTLRALEEAILGFAGTVLVVSHDRFFLDRIATHILAFEGDSHVEWFEGNYQDYEKDRKKRMGADAETPHRIKYRKIDA